MEINIPCEKFFYKLYFKLHIHTHTHIILYYNCNVQTEPALIGRYTKKGKTKSSKNIKSIAWIGFCSKRPKQRTCVNANNWRTNLMARLISLFLANQCCQHYDNKNTSVIKL